MGIPFLYETRIHIFRRDQKMVADIIVRENIILEMYFGNTLRHSPYKWPEEKLTLYKSLSDQWEKPFISKVSRGITTAFGLATAWIVIMVLIAGSWTAGWLWMKRLS